VDQPQTFRSTTALVVWVVWVLFAVGNWIDLAVQGRDHSSVVAAAILLMATGVAYVTALRPRVLVDDAGLTIKNPVRDHRISWAAVTDVDLMDLLRVHCTLPQAPGRGQQGQGERRKVISAWAIHYSRRRQYSADTKARRAATRTAGGSRPSMFGGGLMSATRSMSYGVPAPVPSARSSSVDTEAEAKLIVRLISERATAARAEALWTASTTTPGDTTTSTEAAPSRAAAPASTATAASAAASTRLLTSTWSTRAIAALVIPALILLIVILL
jgi:Bacterial PH domain